MLIQGRPTNETNIHFKRGSVWIVFSYFKTRNVRQKPVKFTPNEYGTRIFIPTYVMDIFYWFILEKDFWIGERQWIFLFPGPPKGLSSPERDVRKRRAFGEPDGESATQIPQQEQRGIH